jgi:methane monooxygenase PmoA-like
MSRNHFRPTLWLAFAGLVACPAVQAADSTAEGVTITQQGDKLRIEIDGYLFSEYHYKDVSRPFLYPIMGPDELFMTRNWPMKEVPDEERDHPHHRSLWYAHGEVNGHDFWAEGAKAGKTIHESFTEIKSGKDVGVITSKNKLVAADGSVVCTDDRTLRIYNRKEGRLFDFEITIRASHGDLTLGDTKEGTLAIRLAETMRLKPNKSNSGKPTGHIINSEGVREGETWGKRAKWVDYYGPVSGKTVGVAIFDHPDNPRYPTWWHVRDYGLFAANPFGLHDFEAKPKGAGDMKIKSGESATFRYRFYIHRGDEKEGKVAERYEEYLKQQKS